MTDATAAMQDAYRGAWEDLRSRECETGPSVSDKILQVMADGRWRTGVDILRDVNKLGQRHSQNEVSKLSYDLHAAKMLKREQVEMTYTYRIRFRT